MAGADAGHGDAGGEVDHPVAVHVLQDAAVGAVDEDRQDDAEAVGDVGLAFGVQGLGTGAGDGGGEVAGLGEGGCGRARRGEDICHRHH